MSDSALIAALAARLRLAGENGQAVAPIAAELPAGSLDTAYAIQNHNTQTWLTQGRRLVGRKIGLTSPAVQAQLGVDQPDFGMLFADMAVGDNQPIAAGRLIQPKVEAEVALVLGRDLVHERHTWADVMRATEYVLPAIEVVDSRIADWQIGLLDTVADNASSGLFVLGGQPRLLRDCDLADGAMVMRRGEEVVSRGNGRACLGHPLNAAVWLADVMVRYGRPLLAGDIVLTGALGPMVNAGPGQTFVAEIAGLGSVTAAFA